MDGEERKIALLIAAFDQERENTAQATAALRQVIAGLGEKVESATGVAVGKALTTLRREADLAAQAMQQLRRLTLWQSAWRHVTTALCAMAITVLAVWWYVPTVGEISALRSERDQLQASIEDLSQRGGRIVMNSCGGRLCIEASTDQGKSVIDWRGAWHAHGVPLVIPKGY
jgi:hypothetical protein